MPDKKSVQTGWVIAATEGSTVDGRTITSQWIKEMAETYSVDEYTAVIWPEHFRSSWGPFEGKNWGTVDEVKAAKKGGKLRLFVKLTANSYLLDANKDGQKLFMSIEINTDFTGTGKCYLQGVAVTDSPASTGTTRLKFSAGTNEVEHDYSQLEVLQHSDFIFARSEPNQNQATQAKTLLTQLLNLFSTEQATEVTDNAEDHTMTEAQLAALMGKFDSVTTSINKLDEKFCDLEAKVEKFSVSEAEEEIIEENPGGESTEPKGDNAITADQFSQLSTTISNLSETVGNMEAKFNKLSQEDDGQEPGAAGKGEQVSLV